MIHILKTGHENLEISCSKSTNSGTSLDKTCVLTISKKYLHIYRINRTIVLSARKLTAHHGKLWILQIFRRNNCIFNPSPPPQKKNQFQKISRMKISHFNNPEKCTKFDYFQPNNCLIAKTKPFTKPNCKKLHI